MIHHGNPLILLQRQVQEITDDLIVFSPFATTDAVESILSQMARTVRLTMAVRWSKRDIVLGSSDLDVARLVAAVGGRLLRNPLLHAKLFMFDKACCVIGSANVTSRGLGLIPGQANIECISEIYPVHPEDIVFVNRVIRSSQIVKPELVEEMRQQLEERDVTDWNEQKLEAVTQRPDGIFVNDLPFCASPSYLIQNPDSEEAAHDRAIFGPSVGAPSLDQLATPFRKSSAVTWLDSTLHNEMSFGQLSHALHNSLLDDPRPYRKDVKVLQSNLLEWVTALLPDSFEVEVPPGSHSQVIRKL